MAVEAGSLTIVNLRDGGSLKLRFPAEINTDDRTNWNSYDVAGGLKPLSFANVEPQNISFDDLVLDNSIIQESVEPTIEKLRGWMRPRSERDGSPPQLQIATVGWSQRAVLTSLQVRREFFTPAGTCIRAYLQISFEEISDPTRGVGGVRSRNSLSGRTTIR
jgi:hypothetical protein